MSNKMRRVLAAGLACLLVLAAALPAAAASAKTEPKEELHIRSNEDFLRFAEDCRLDAYSQDLTVLLEADLDLTGSSFAGVPIFAGNFQGGGHTIKGLSLTEDGSAQGLFRYVTKTAVVQDLTVLGEVAPEGTRSTVGGIVGENRGTIRNCHFAGKVSGSRMVGGIAGVNAVSGCIEDSRAEGQVSGDHFAGGIAGENNGTVRRCENLAEVNITEDQNQVDLADISLHTISGAESTHTVTDIGGIVGTSSGVVRDCVNQGPVGYLHMGYNVGGIAGSQTGLIAGCVNNGPVRGRKEVGGIVGQCEPVQQLDYRKDTLQMMQQQMQQTSSLAAQTATSMKNGAAALHEQANAMQGHANNASDAIDQLLPDKENGIPDLDTVQAAKNSLSSSVSAMNGVMDSMKDTAQANATTLSGQIEALAKQMNVMGNTIAHAGDHLGGKMQDISDKDTPEDLTGKVANSRNVGTVEGDVNVGGIAGAMSWENDWDPEDDLSVSGSRSLNVQGELRAVIRECENQGLISAKKRQAGGIVGLAACGLVKDCTNTGNLDAESARQVGGIAGTSTGWLRGCSAKCELNGQSRVGGIAGSASRATDCSSVVRIVDGDEKLGAVLGEQTDTKEEEKEPVARNWYLVTDEDLGGIDGISYAGQAQATDRDSFLQLETLPASFAEVHLTFTDRGGHIETRTVPLGMELNPDEIPAVPDKPGAIGRWEGLDELDLQHMYFDQSFPAVYDGHRSFLRSEETRPDGAAILLAEGVFCTSENVPLTAWDGAPLLEESQTRLEGWQVPQFEQDKLTGLRISCPEGYDIDRVEVLVQSAENVWRRAETQRNGQYLDFDVDPMDVGFCLVEVPQPFPWLWAAGGAVVLLLVIALAVRHHKKRSAKKIPAHAA